MEYLKIKQLEVQVHGTTLFTAANLSVQTNQKIGLIGANGSGKSTLLRILQQEASDLIWQGQVKRNCSLILVPQILATSERSGGEQEKQAIRLALKQVRQFGHAVLLLDEPTANLDLPGQSWLVDGLLASSTPMIVVSHDRHFLSQIVNTVWQIADQKVTAFNGNFTQFEAKQRQQAAKIQTAYQQQQQKIKKLRAAEQHQQERASRARRKKKNLSWAEWKERDYSGKEKKLLQTKRNLAQRFSQEAATLAKPYQPKPLTLNNLNLQQVQLEKAGSLLRLDPQVVSIAQRPFLTLPETLKIKNGQKIALIGPNGSGKSLFLSKLAMQELRGWQSPQLRIGYFQQDLAPLQKEPLQLQEAISQNSLFAREAALQLLGDLHLKEQLTNSVTNLSGGQLICYQLARVLLGQHNLLLLDEPNNYLDLTAIKALESFLQSYPFAVILVTHDQQLLHNLNYQSWTITKQQLVSLDKQPHSTPAPKTNELRLLRFKLDQALSDPTVSMTEIQQLQAEIVRCQADK